MSAASPLIADWVANKLTFGYDYLAEKLELKPLVLPKAVSPTRLTYIKIYDRDAPEGTFLLSGVGFDDPRCGVRFECGVPLDTGPGHTVAALISSGNLAPNVMEYALIPPTTPPGVYSLLSMKEWIWVKWLRLYVFNADITADHHCWGYGATIAFLLDERPPMPRELLDRLIEETRKATAVLPAAPVIPVKPVAPSMAEEVSNVKLTRRVP